MGDFFLILPPYVLIVGLGLALGSYLNSWIWRVHESKWRWGGRSECVHCGRGLTWYENIPLASFAALRGKCRTCQKKIPLDYFLVELAAPLLLIIITHHHLALPVLNPWHYFRDLFFVALLIVVFVYDAKYQIILPPLMWLGAALAFVLNYFFLGFSAGSLALGILVGAGFFLLQYAVSRGRWIGGGDIHLGLLMGALLGWPNILAALFFSYVVGALVSVPLLISGKKQWASQIPFGTFLAAGTMIAMLWGSGIIEWYTGLL